MLIDRLTALEPASERAVIINCSTRLVSTLALLATLRYARIPTLVVDCESTDGSMDHFRSLMERYDFDVMEAPLRSHGETLDRLFRDVPAEKVLLVDSDAEILSARVLDFFREYIDEPSVFGCGFTNGPGWLDSPGFGEIQGALYHERMFMPLTLLKVAPIREALDEGVSFAATRYDNEYSLLKPLAALRRRSGVVRRILGTGPSWLRANCHGVRPATIYYDTGARIFDFLRYRKMLHFVGLPEPVHPRFCNHFFGTTRIALYGAGERATTEGGGPSQIDPQVRRRLAEEYGEVGMATDTGRN